MSRLVETDYNTLPLAAHSVKCNGCHPERVKAVPFQDSQF